ncbi:PhoH family protein [Microvirga pudoricolor]|uniref:PhoH family protein n=1 Tax=Microvirga pudoricolor TaxID=2778729 RepID=UPI00194EF337|nr:PhoH family protein [Microvirga pudoricolor]MBM6595560.1 PhoH family protein [Microvirga pudoricolor]
MAKRKARGSKEAFSVKTKFDATERKLPPIRPLTEKQADYLEALEASDQVIALGVAGTGKTFIAATFAADQYRQRKIRKIILTKPNAPAGRSYGFLPGTIEEKTAPWVLGMTEAIKERIGAGAFDIAMKNGDIEVVPFETMRGRTFKDAFVLLSESQNCTVDEIKLFLSRIGDDCKVVLDGDLGQKDIKESSGLATAIHLIKKDCLPVPIIEFDLGDIVRSGICAMWVKSFHRAGL